MSRLAPAVALPLLLAQAPVAVDVFELPPVTAPEYVPVQPNSPPQGEVVSSVAAIACGMAPPLSFAEWRQRADAIVRVRLDSQTTYDHDMPETGNSYVMTAHEATVLDVFKADPRAMAAGSSMTILQYGGTIRRSDGLHAVRWNHFDIMPRETEWVLFLTWTAHVGGFIVPHFENGAFRIQGDTIATAGRAPFAESWKGKPPSEFVSALAEEIR